MSVCSVLSGRPTGCRFWGACEGAPTPRPPQPQRAVSGRTSTERARAYVVANSAGGGGLSTGMAGYAAMVHALKVLWAEVDAADDDAAAPDAEPEPRRQRVNPKARWADSTE